jgi:hypothetical protein
MNRKQLAPPLFAFLLSIAPSNGLAAQVLWSTGEPRAATANNATMERESWLYISGYVDAATPQRYAAAPFRLGQDAMITGINALYTDLDRDTGLRTMPTDVSFKIWARESLDAPTMVVREGSFGPYVLGQRFTNADVTFENDYIHSHAVDFRLDAGDYYLTLYSEDTTINWATGGQQPDATLEQDLLWRSRRFPDPGFEQYVFPQDPILLSDKRDIYNLVFSIVGEPVPEPSLAPMLLAIAAAALLRRRARAGRRLTANPISPGGPAIRTPF